MDKILIIDCRSTSINYIQDAWDMGYQPVVLEPIGRHCLFSPQIDDYTMFGAKQPIVVKEQATYHQTLAMVKEINPKAIVAGNDLGIGLTLRLCADLGIKNTSVNNFKTMRNKYFTQLALKKAGLRYIKTRLISKAAEALKFFEDVNHRTIVVKPTAGESSMGVYVCATLEELHAAIAREKETLRLSTDLRTFIIQEFIGGDEYVVNSVSCNGKHKVTSISHYTKKLVPGFAPVYECSRFVHDVDDPKIKQLIEYNNKVLDVVGVEYGPCHAEYKFDEKGPVLIETNCRIPGGTMNKIFLDPILGHHETNLSLAMYLDNSTFDKLPDVNKNVGHGMIKFIILPNAIDVSNAKFMDVITKLPSYITCINYVKQPEPGKTVHLHRTVDFETYPFSVFLASTNKDVVEKDHDVLNDIEEHHLDQFFDYTISK